MSVLLHVAIKEKPMRHGNLLSRLQHGSYIALFADTVHKFELTVCNFRHVCQGGYDNAHLIAKMAYIHSCLPSKILSP